MLPALDYHRPATLGEACSLLERFGADAVALAGGTDVVVDLRRGARRPRHLVSLRDVAELRGIRVADGLLRLGALTTAAEMAAAPELPAARPDLLDALRVFAGPQIRNVATLGGNLCTAASCGDLAPMLIALGARVRLAGPAGERTLPLEEFFRDARATVLAPGEILVEVTVPVRAAGDGARYEAFGRRAASFITVAGVAAAVHIENGNCRRARVVLGAVAPIPLLVPAAAKALEGRAPDDASIGAAAAAARAAALPISDVRGSAEHRRDIVEVLTRRALLAARERAQS